MWAVKFLLSYAPVTLNEENNCKIHIKIESKNPRQNVKLTIIISSLKQVFS